MWRWKKKCKDVGAACLILYIITACVQRNKSSDWNQNRDSLKSTVPLDDETTTNNWIDKVLEGIVPIENDDPVLLDYIIQQMKPPSTNKPLNLSSPLHTGQVKRKNIRKFVNSGYRDNKYMTTIICLMAKSVKLRV